MQAEWIRKPQAGISVVFVHGILSDGEACWRNENGSYWPELLKNEADFASLGIYLFTYQTGIFSGTYRVSDVVDALKEWMRLDGVLESDRVVFVCHSLGGIVVRKFLVERTVELIQGKKEIALFLVASPSLGADYADWLAPVAQVFGHAQADALRFVRQNHWLMDLDKEFTNLKEAGKLKIKGKELIEDKFLIFKGPWRKQVVEPFAGARYFGEPFKVPGSDHFSIAKPKDSTVIQHRLLCQFLKEILQSSTQPLPSSGRFDAGFAQTPSLSRPSAEVPSQSKHVPSHSPSVQNPRRRGTAMKLFYSYSHKDEALREELETHLSVLKRQGVIASWHDRKISAGSEWAGEIDKNLDEADVILLLVSADFLGSDYCYDKEMKQALERHDAREGRVIPVILRPVDWKGAPFAKLQMLPRDAKPVTSWNNRDDAWLDVAKGIRKAVEELAANPL